MDPRSVLRKRNERKELDQKKTYQMSGLSVFKSLSL